MATSLSHSLGKLVPKSLVIREEDYWILAVSCVTVLSVAAAIYASVLLFRLPVVILAVFGLWFTFVKVKKGYGRRHAGYHLAITLAIGILLFIGFYALTN